MDHNPSSWKQSDIILAFIVFLICILVALFSHGDNYDKVIMSMGFK